ncbi:pseudouridine synthase [Mycoplasma struthionis]|uniref:Pseudouridine synthase n=1 Tax=Mycoplasma struthionis TaxID=538220 RepID=A0A3G8LGL6_9MOLU|nr:pseudouridine synthase [Mycoplasma struthionis]AZG68806.1 rRNA pseudouridine synthase [Mycoplasma struthionis]TPI01579.1 rRNA pseudouridine synthase [Mycoplasma struthionis]
MEEKIKVQKLLSELGICSRREGEKLIEKGLIKVNKQVVLLGDRCSRNDLIEINGKKVEIKKIKHEYYVLNKPRNCICTLKDPENRKTIYQVMNLKGHYFSVGRLDFNTTGVIIITNDGEFKNKLEHPSNNLKREYIVNLEKELDEKNLRYLNSNFVKLNGKYSKQIVKPIAPLKYSVTLWEGRNHHVKNLFLLVNNYVTSLHRKAYGSITDKNLKIGMFRALSEDEVNELKK